MEINTPLYSPFTFSQSFQDLASKSRSEVQHENKNRNALYKIRVISMLFLDKIDRLIGEHHPNCLTARALVGTPASFASIEMIKYLSQLLIHPSLNANSIQHLNKWIASEQRCVPINFILDVWRAQFNTNKKISKDEVEIFSVNLSCLLKSMKPGDQFKLPTGSIFHATRILLIKTTTETFDLIHFNTGAGTFTLNGTDNTACAYTTISTKALEDPLFWKQLIAALLSPTMNNLNNLLQSLTSNLPIDVHPCLKKQLQKSGSCSIKSIEAEFKYSFISSFSNLEEGWEAYKQCKSLILSAIVKQDLPYLSPGLKETLQAKEKIWHRFQDWKAATPEVLAAIKDVYERSLTMLGITLNPEPSHLSPILALNLLNKRINFAFNYASCNQLTQIRNMATMIGMYQIGDYQMNWLGFSYQAFQMMAHQKKPHLEPEVLRKYLTEYILRESSLLAESILYRLKAENIIPKDFTYDHATLINHLIQRNALALELADDDILMQACSFLTNTCIKLNIDKSAFLAERIFESKKKATILMNITLAYLYINAITEAKAIAQLIPQSLEQRKALLSISYWLVNAEKIQEAASIVYKIPESQEKGKALLNILNAQLMNGFIEDAKIILPLIKQDPERIIAIQNLQIKETYYNYT